MRNLSDRNIDAILMSAGIDAKKGGEIVVSVSDLRSAVKTSYELGLDAECMKAIMKGDKDGTDKNR